MKQKAFLMWAGLAAIGLALAAQAQVNTQPGIQIVPALAPQGKPHAWLDAGGLGGVRFAAAATDANWIPLGGIAGVAGIPRAVLCDEGGAVYMGGGFDAAENCMDGNLVAWDGRAWSPVGGGVDGEVFVLGRFGADLYVGGFFECATNVGGGVVTSPGIVRWDGTRWWAVGRGLVGGITSPRAYALAVSGTNLYVGGQFAYAKSATGGTTSSESIVRWDGTRWFGLGGGVDRTVYALAVSGTNLYAGGSFEEATNPNGGVVNTGYIARWDGERWSSLGRGLNDWVESLCVVGDSLYVGGDFTEAVNANGTVVPAKHIARWSEGKWTPVAGGLDGASSAMVKAGECLYVGGSFTSAANADGARVVCPKIIRWDGVRWSPVGLGMGASQAAWGYDHSGDGVCGLAVSGASVYAVGDFVAATNTGPALVNSVGIARWDGARWSGLGGNPGLNDTSRCVARLGADVYYGGDFSVAGGCESPGIARWDGSGWRAVGRGVNGCVHALATWDARLMVGGTFTAALTSDGQAVVAPRLACWDGREWRGAGGGLNGDVLALASANNALYVGGTFTAATNANGTVTQVSRIARWDGATWSPLARGVDGPVHAILVRDGDIVVGGEFKAATNASNTRITSPGVARWDGQAWSAIGRGMDIYGGAIDALAALGTNLYVGGTFSAATNGNGIAVAACGAARWNGQSWSAVSSKLDWECSVYALCVVNTNLYLGGCFGSLWQNSGVLCWNGATLSKPGACDDGVQALLQAGPNLYAANCMKAGGQAAGHAARLALGPATGAALLAPRIQEGRLGFDLPTGKGTGYTVEVSPSLSAPAWAPAAVFDGDGTTRTVTFPVQSQPEGYCRVRSL